MKLIILLILAFLNSSIKSEICYNFNEISKSNSLKLTTATSSGLCVYLDTNSLDSTIEIYVKVQYGHLTYYNNIYYDSFTSPPSSGKSVNLDHIATCDGTSYSNYYNYYSYYYYDEITYYYKIKKQTNRYLYMYISPVTSFSWGYYVEIGVYTSLPLWLIIVIVCIVIIVGIILTTVWRIFKRRRESYISPPADYQQPYSPMPGPGVPYY